MKSCPYCEKAAYFYFSTASRNYYRCLACDLIYQGRRDSYPDVVTNYRQNYFERYSIDQLEGGRTRLYDHILNLIEEGRGVGKLLDVGTGCGFFLVAAKKRRWEVRGVDPSIQSVEVARSENRLDVFHGTVGEYYRNGGFDAITLINVLDHSALPWQEIHRVKKLLRSGGLIYLRFPNGFLHSRIYRMAHKCGLISSLRKFLVVHTYSFTPQYVTRLLNDHGFVKISILISPPSEGDAHELFPDPSIATYVKRLIYLIAKCTETISCKRLLLGTSLEVTALKPN
jgi:2-polyprenyl-3-methyl-5-hydroxy-6-metoxy-1,4-benzoquinol methylase